MPRIRSVHPDIAEDEALVHVTASAERTFVRLWTYLDDEGRGKDHPKLIKAAIYPLHDHMTPDAVDADLWELVEHGLLLRYDMDGVKVIAAKPGPWARWQKPKHRNESKLPPPPEDYTPPTPPDQPRNNSERPGNTPPVPARTRSNPEQLGTTGEHAPGSLHGVGEGVGEGVGGERETRAAPRRPGQLVPVPPNDSAPSARVHVLYPQQQRAATGDYPSDFEAWWALYPRKRAKADAFHAWKRARGVATWEELIGGLRRSVEAWEREKTPPDKIPYPATWLNGRRWEDEPDLELARRSEPAGFDTLRDVLADRAARRTS